MSNNLKLLRLRATSFRSAIEKETDKVKATSASVAIVENLNKLIDDIVNMLPDLKDHLPARVNPRGPFAHMGSASVTYLDLEILAEQILAVLNSVEG